MSSQLLNQIKLNQSIRNELKLYQIKTKCFFSSSSLALVHMYTYVSLCHCSTTKSTANGQ